VDAHDVLPRLSKNKKQKNKSRKLGRNFKWDGATHSMTKYRGGGNRERNKARRSEQRKRRLAKAAARREERNGIYLKDDRSEEAANQPS
jgi:hypothetical protein